MCGRSAARRPIPFDLRSGITFSLLPVLGIGALCALVPASSARAQDPPAPAQAPAAPGQSPAAAPQDAAAPAAAPQQPDAPPAAPVPVTTLQVTVRNTTNNFVIDNAAVRLESETERSRSRATSRLGIALFQKIPDGTYNVIVQAVGFKTATLNGVVVAPGKTTNVIISMQVNAQTVVVRRARETLNVRDTSISVIRDQAFFQDIPFNAENRQDLNLRSIALWDRGRTAL